MLCTCYICTYELIAPKKSQITCLDCKLYFCKFWSVAVSWYDMTYNERATGWSPWAPAARGTRRWSGCCPRSLRPPRCAAPPPRPAPAPPGRCCYQPALGGNLATDREVSLEVTGGHERSVLTRPRTGKLKSASRILHHIHPYFIYEVIMKLFERNMK